MLLLNYFSLYLSLAQIAPQMKIYVHSRRSCDRYLHLARAKRHVHPAPENRQHGNDFIGDLNSMTDARPHSIVEVQTGSGRHQLRFANGRAVYSSHVFLLGFNGIGSCGTNCKSRVWLKKYEVHCADPHTVCSAVFVNVNGCSRVCACG